MSPRELLATAESRLLALDEEVRNGGTFADRTAVARALADLAQQRVWLELVRLQAFQQRVALANDNPYRASAPGTLADFTLDT